MFKTDARTIGFIVTFTALTIILNLSPIKIPAPYAPYLIYQVWEVPIVAAFLLYGFSISLIVALTNTLALLVIFPGALITGPFYNLAAVISMLIGLSIPKMARLNPSKNVKTLALYTALGIASRVVFMTLINWIFLRFPPPVGFALSEEAIIASLPIIAFFNATLAAYTIPLGVIIAKTLKSVTK
ncbi:MAG: hypothetical protein QXT06_00815 [Candidatus Bathyarchaeia archaeon]